MNSGLEDKKAKDQKEFRRQSTLLKNKALSFDNLEAQQVKKAIKNYTHAMKKSKTNGPTNIK